MTSCARKAMVGRGPGTVSAVALLAVLCAVAVSPVLAQDADSLPDVADRYEGTGMHAGSFWLLPTLESGLFYDSNIYARNRNIRDGIGTYVAPRLELHSDWGLHELNVELGASQYVYFDDPELNKTNVDGSIDGRIDLRRDLVLLGGVKGGHFEQGLGDTNTNSLAAEPTRHEEGEAWASINKAFNRLSVSVGGGYHFYDYHDVDSILGGVIDQDFRDGDVFETGGRVSYAISPGTRVFGDFRYNWRDYRGGGADSDGWRGLTGLEFEMSRLMRGEIGVGYMEQYYGAGPDSSGISYHAGLTWNPTPLMTVKLDADWVFFLYFQLLEVRNQGGSPEQTLQAILQPFQRWIDRSLQTDFRQHFFEVVSGGSDEGLAYSERHRRRLYQQQIGLAPKQVARIVRFQQALHELRTADEVSLEGYYDQAHFIREFRAFTGMTPTAYRRAYGG